MWCPRNGLKWMEILSLPKAFGQRSIPQAFFGAIWSDPRLPESWRQLSQGRTALRIAPEHQSLAKDSSSEAKTALRT